MAMRACEPEREGFVDCGGLKLHYEVYGEAGPTLLLLPTWTIIHKRFWKLQLAYLARHMRVVTYDGPGNGLSDLPTDPAAYRQEAQVRYALAVLDATGTDRACLVSLSAAANWALDLAANHPGRVLGSAFIGPAVDLADAHPERAEHIDADGQAPTNLAPSRVRLGGDDPLSDWAKYNVDYWREHHEDFLWFFFGQCFS
jgi:pimeloyl-ACP methyl ester carboxylesterase